MDESVITIEGDIEATLGNGFFMVNQDKYLLMSSPAENGVYSSSLEGILTIYGCGLFEFLPGAIMRKKETTYGYILNEKTLFIADSTVNYSLTKEMFVVDKIMHERKELDDESI